MSSWVTSIFGTEGAAIWLIIGIKARRSATCLIIIPAKISYKHPHIFQRLKIITECSSKTASCCSHRYRFRTSSHCGVTCSGPAQRTWIYEDQIGAIRETHTLWSTCFSRSNGPLHVLGCQIGALTMSSSITVIATFVDNNQTNEIKRKEK